MCAAFTLRPTRDQILSLFDIQLPEDFSFDKRVLPQGSSLVVVGNSRFELRDMVFSMTPSWSKESKVKFATHNARLETILEKPTWRAPLKTHRCLVPISEFIEPIYRGEFAGNMVRFAEPTHQLLVAAGLYDVWVNKETGEIRESFAIITSEPPEFVQKMGHDRCPLFLKPNSFAKWLDIKNTDAAHAVDLLKSNWQDLDFTVSVDRPLAKGWEKRIP